MLIKCHNCGHENLLGAIFCRNCGEKLDIETMRPEIQKSGNRAGGIFGIIRRLVGLLVLLGVIGLGVALFLPEASNPSTLSTDEEKAAADKKFQEFMQRVDEGFGRDDFAFTIPEINYLYNSKFISSSGSGDSGSFFIERLDFSVDPFGYLHFYLKTKFSGKIDTSFKVKGALKGETAPIGVTIIEAKMGKVPFPFLQDKVAGKFDPLINDPRTTKILDSIEKAEVSEDRQQISIKLKEKIL